jgi:hypothetical protein
MGAALLLTGCGRDPPARYEFHSGGSGAILWRCNRLTGEVDVASYGNMRWRRVPNQPDQAAANAPP